MNSVEKIKSSFLLQSTRRKLTLIGGISGIVILTAGLLSWAMTPTYGVLFSQMDSQDASQILTQLEQEHIAYRVKNQGQDIWIDKPLIDKTRIKLMSQDLKLTHSVGFELFDKTDFGMTDFSQKINFQRALQGELERTITSLDEVKQARVQLTIPESHLFQQENHLPRVAVTLHLQRPLTAGQVNSIRQLITASVANLPASNVVMVDQNGNGLNAIDDDAPSSHFLAKQKVEHYLNEKVMQMLRPIFTNDGVMVKIDATLNYDELVRERIEPQQHGWVTHEKESRHSVTNKTEKTARNQDFTREKNYEFGHEKEQFTRANGTIQRLTISVVLPQNTSRDKIVQIERLVKSVVGFDALRGDIISVEALSVMQQATRLENNVLAKSPVISISQGIVGMGIVLGILLIWMHRRRGLRFTERQRLLTALNQWLIEHD